MMWTPGASALRAALLQFKEWHCSCTTGLSLDGHTPDGPVGGPSVQDPPLHPGGRRGGSWECCVLQCWFHWALHRPTTRSQCLGKLEAIGLLIMYWSIANVSLHVGNEEYRSDGRRKVRPLWSLEVRNNFDSIVWPSSRPSASGQLLYSFRLDLFIICSLIRLCLFVCLTSTHPPPNFFSLDSLAPPLPPFSLDTLCCLSSRDTLSLVHSFNSFISPLFPCRRLNLFS